MSVTEDEYNETLAKDIVVIATGADDGEFMFIALIDGDYNIVQEMDRNLARAVAYRLMKLADDAPPPRVILPSRDELNTSGSRDPEDRPRGIAGVHHAV